MIENHPDGSMLHDLKIMETIWRRPCLGKQAGQQHKVAIPAIRHGRTNFRRRAPRRQVSVVHGGVLAMNLLFSGLPPFLLAPGVRPDIVLASPI